MSTNIPVQYSSAGLHWGWPLKGSIWIALSWKLCWCGRHPPASARFSAGWPKPRELLLNVCGVLCDFTRTCSLDIDCVTCSFWKWLFDAIIYILCYYMIYMLYYVFNMLFVFLSDCDWASCCHEWDIWVSLGVSLGIRGIVLHRLHHIFTHIASDHLAAQRKRSTKWDHPDHGGLGGPRPEFLSSEPSAENLRCLRRSELWDPVRHVSRPISSFQGFLPACPSYLVTLCEANLDSFEAIPLVLGSCLIHYCATAAGLVLMLHKVA